MPEKLPAVERGLFIARERQAEKDEEDATDLARAQKVDDPRTGAVFLSLVNRLSSLEAAVRGERLRRLGAEERRDVVVLDNIQAQEEIKTLQRELLALERKLASFIEAPPGISGLVNEALDLLAGEPQEMGFALDPAGTIVQVWASQIRNVLANIVTLFNPST